MARRRKPPITHPPAQAPDEVPGASSNPATNLLMVDVAMRAGSIILRRVLERGLLKGRYGKDTAEKIVENRSIGKTLATAAAARLATRSTPGAVLVGSGLAAKLLFDRSQKRRKARRQGDAELLEQAADE